MKRYKKRISLLLILTMIITTLSFSVVAAEEIPSDTDQALTVENSESSDAPADIPSDVSEDIPSDVPEDIQDQAVPDSQADETSEDIVEDISEETYEMKMEGLEEEPFKITDVKAVLNGYSNGKAAITVTWSANKDAEFVVSPSQGDPQTVTENQAVFELPVGAKYTFTVSGTAGEETSTSNPSNEIDAKAASVSGLKTHPGYRSVILDWVKSDSADGYAVYYSTAKNGTYKLSGTATNKANISKYDSGRVLYEVKGLQEFTVYYFKVVAFYGDQTNPAGAVAAAYNQPVRPITYVLTIKKNVTLKKHGGSGPSKLYLKKGQKISAVGFNSGKYVIEYKGSVFNATKSRAKKVTCSYNKTLTYDRISAEYYVNRRGLSSSTKQLIWVSTYTQKIYVFTGSKGKWVLKNYWKVSTGKASSPTPTGNYGFKKVWKRVKTRHGIKYWTCFSSMNAFHGLFKSWVKKLGTPASGGCVRNPVAKAQWLYNNNNIRMGTTVFIR